MRQLLNIAELMYRRGPARAAASALEAVASAPTGRIGILATPVGLQCAAGLAKPRGISLNSAETYGMCCKAAGR